MGKREINIIKKDNELEQFVNNNNLDYSFFKKTIFGENCKSVNQLLEFFKLFIATNYHANITSLSVELRCNCHYLRKVFKAIEKEKGENIMDIFKDQSQQLIDLSSFLLNRELRDKVVDREHKIPLADIIKIYQTQSVLNEKLNLSSGITTDQEKEDRKEYNKFIKENSTDLGVPLTEEEIESL